MLFLRGLTPPARLFTLFALLVASASSARAAEPLSFELTFDKKVSPRPYTGRVYVLLTKKEMKELPDGVSWFKPEPFFALDVKDWQPGTPLTIDRNCLGHPVELSKLPADTYSLIAVMDFKPGSRHFIKADGNAYSNIVRAKLDTDASGPIKLTIDKTYREPAFKETDRVKLVDIESKLLSSFYGRPTHLHAGVILPASYEKMPKKRYPVVYEIPGFGGSHHSAHARAKRDPTNLNGLDVIWVMLDPNCHHGHHVFADSANNGPVGAALTKELIPAIEKKFRAVGAPAGRLVTGHSSGGWSSLWLQTTYPDFFNGVWSTAPDPVDFRDFQKVNVYRDANLYFDKEGKRRPLARKDGKPVMYAQDFCGMEFVIGHGGQMRSFEAVFSPRGPDGAPIRLWDPQSGKIDHQVAKEWQKYDIRLNLEKKWPDIGPRLKGKIHVYMGEEDTFYLNGATECLKKSLAKLKSDAVVELFPKRTHFNLIDKKLRERINKEMADRLRAAGF